MIYVSEIKAHFDVMSGTIDGRPKLVRRLSDLRGSFADTQAYERALAAGDPVVYTVASVEPATGSGQLHYGLGMVMPGKVGDEYFLTKGHLHAWRDAAEVYIGLTGGGLMLLENEVTGETETAPLGQGDAVYVPGFTAHRTINTGDLPLTYMGVYPSEAGHDYGAIAERNFLKVVVDRDGLPALLPREEYLSGR
jgi:glucose-6-phosphate isomerase